MIPESINKLLDEFAREERAWTWHEASPFPVPGAVNGVPEARAALEAAIEAELAKRTEPPTDAEIEAWELGARQAPVGDGSRQLFFVAESDLRDAVALMRRAKAHDALARLRERVLAAEMRNAIDRMLDEIEEHRRRDVLYIDACEAGDCENEGVAFSADDVWLCKQCLDACEPAKDTEGDGA